MRGISIFAGIGILVAQILFSPTATFASAGAGTSGADFLELPVGGRSVAMGGATGALPGDESALFRNPALLAAGSGLQIQVSHQDWYQGLQFESVLFSLSLPGKLGRVALHGRYLHLEPITVYDSQLEEVGEVDVYDLAAGLSWATRISGRWDLGLNLHSLRQHLAGDNGTGLACDLGLGAVASGFYWSASLRNLGQGVRYESDNLSYDLDREFSMGLARFIPQVNSIVSFEYRHPMLMGSSTHAGAEYLVTNRLTLRAGYSLDMADDVDSMGQMSFGAGFKVSGLGLDYSYLSHQHLGDVFTISVSFLGQVRNIAPYQYFRPSM